MKASVAGILFAASVILLSGLTACKCDSEKQVDQKQNPSSGVVSRDFESTVEKLVKADLVDVLALIPSNVDSALVSDHPDKFYSWLQSKPWWKDAKLSPVWQDLYLTSPFALLSSARHRLASLSPVRFKLPTVEEFLSTPLGVGVRKTENGSSILLVKQIDLRVQALQRLAEVFNQIKDQDTARVQSIDGIRLRSVELGKQRLLHYVVFSNLLLLSNDIEMLEDSLALARGKERGKSLEGDGDTLLSKLKKVDLELMLKPEKYPLVALTAPVSMMALGWSGEHPDTMRLVGVADQKPAGSYFGRDDKLLSMLPADSRIVSAMTGFDVSKAWSRVIGALNQKTQGALLSPIGSIGKILKKTGKKMVLDFLEIDPMRPAIVVFVELKNRADTSWLKKAISAEIEFATGKKAGKINSIELPGLDMWSVESGVLSPAFAFKDQWLVLGSNRQSLFKVMKTIEGKSPSLMDRDGIGVSMAPDDATAGMYLINFEAVFKDLVKNSRKIISSSERFDSNDLDSTWIPFFKSLEKLSLLAGSWSVQGTILRGQVVAL